MDTIEISSPEVFGCLELHQAAQSVTGELAEQTALGAINLEVHPKTPQLLVIVYEYLQS
jgi:hypothetical protein